MSQNRPNNLILIRISYSEYWEKPYFEWGDTKTWDHYFFIKNNRDVMDQISHDALGKELKVLAENLKPRTREIKKVQVI